VFAFGTHGAPFNDRFQRLDVAPSRTDNATEVSVLVSKTRASIDDLVGLAGGASHHRFEVRDSEAPHLRTRLEREIRTAS
jgi:hypothetical protein